MIPQRVLGEVGPAFLSHAIVNGFAVSARVLKDLSEFSHEAVRLWFRRLREALPKPERMRRRVVAVDETKLERALIGYPFSKLKILYTKEECY